MHGKVTTRVLLGCRTGSLPWRTWTFGPAGWGMGCTVGDVDNDGDPDVYATYLGPNRLYLNDAGQRLPEVAGGFGVADPGWGASAAFGDLDADGLLDLYITNYVEFNLSDPGRHGVDCPYKGLPVFCGPANFVRQPDKVYRKEGAWSQLRRHRQ